MGTKLSVLLCFAATANTLMLASRPPMRIHVSSLTCQLASAQRQLSMSENDAPSLPTADLMAQERDVIVGETTKFTPEEELYGVSIRNADSSWIAPMHEVPQPKLN